MKIGIYQINIDRDTEHRAFMDTEKLKHFFGNTEVKSELYDKVFCGEVDCISLEDVYRKFNLDHPRGYRGRSLSVSDIVEVTEADSIENGYYFVDFFGFKNVSFEPEKTQDISSPDKIAVLLITPTQAPRIVHIKPEHDEMVRLIGGEPYEYMPFDDDVALVCNRDGQAKQLPPNREIRYASDGRRSVIQGEFFLAGANYDSEKYHSLPDDLIKKYYRKFKSPERFELVGGDFVKLPSKSKEHGYDR